MINNLEITCDSFFCGFHSVFFPESIIRHKRTVFLRYDLGSGGHFSRLIIREEGKLNFCNCSNYKLQDKQNTIILGMMCKVSVQTRMQFFHEIDQIVRGFAVLIKKIVNHRQSQE